jgi:glutathione S-transferase
VIHDADDIYFPISLALHLKGIDFEYKAVHLVKDGGEQNKDDYKALNFLGQVTRY